MKFLIKLLLSDEIAAREKVMKLPRAKTTYMILLVLFGQGSVLAQDSTRRLTHVPPRVSQVHIEEVGDDGQPVEELRTALEIGGDLFTGFQQLDSTNVDEAINLYNRTPVNHVYISLRPGIVSPREKLEVVNKFLNGIATRAQHRVTHIMLNKIGLQEVPESLIQYKDQLLLLNMSENSLGSLGCIDKLTQLRRLYLSDNMLGSLHGIQYLCNLQELHVSRNQLTDRGMVPLEDLNKLSTLYFSGNPSLTKLPSVVDRMKQRHEKPFIVYDKGHMDGCYAEEILQRFGVTDVKQLMDLAHRSALTYAPAASSSAQSSTAISARSSAEIVTFKGKELSKFVLDVFAGKEYAQNRERVRMSMSSRRDIHIPDVRSTQLLAAALEASTTAKMPFDLRLDLKCRGAQEQYDELHQFFTDIAQCECVKRNLQKLDISCASPLPHLPVSIDQLQGLEELTVFASNGEYELDVPDAILALTKLRELRLQPNVSRIPDLGEMPALRRLGLGSYSSSDLPEALEAKLRSGAIGLQDPGVRNSITFTQFLKNLQTARHLARNTPRPKLKIDLRRNTVGGSSLGSEDARLVSGSTRFSAERAVENSIERNSNRPSTALVPRAQRREKSEECFLM